MVVLDQGAPVFEAARAIENNNIGAVVVQHRGNVVGILTDRDLAIRVLAHALDPNTTTIADVMTRNVATLSPSDDQSDAIRLMQDRNCRRIPLVEHGRVVGMVTLDDLLLDEAAPIGELAAIVHAQIGEGGPAPTPRAATRARARSLARAEATYYRLLALVRERTGLTDAAEAEGALEVVLNYVLRRLTPEEARDLIAQLPSLLHEELRSLPPGPDKSITRSGIEEAVARRLGVDGERAAEILLAVGECIAYNVSAGQIDDVRRQLPAALRDIFPDPALASAGAERRSSGERAAGASTSARRRGAEPERPSPG